MITSAFSNQYETLKRSGTKIEITRPRSYYTKDSIMEDELKSMTGMKYQQIVIKTDFDEYPKKSVKSEKIFNNHQIHKSKFVRPHSTNNNIKINDDDDTCNLNNGID